MLINNKELAEEKVLLLITDIKKKKELNSISDDFVKNQLETYLQKNPKALSSLIKGLNKKSSEYKRIVKEMRALLRRVYGLFRPEGSKEREYLIKELSNKKDQLNIIIKILETHSSTKERLPLYSELYKKIFEITGKPEILADFGSGINPFSYPFMKLTKLKYYAYDINLEEVNALNTFFQQMKKENKNFNGKAEVLDLLKLRGAGELKKPALKKADLAFLFKITDVLDQGKGHKVTEEVIRNIPARFIVVSFPTKTMSGKKMNFPRRKWIELMCERLGYKFKILEFSNEIFYVIKM
ncbi:MAG: hypothetical protein KKA62_03425 [Nanoarchaeota archaeon]|nr:hypothetical protein [Nanoarchaeota archaeon]MBU1644588.1 hypothetical protein [Nanoarchaeota archaeon]MBU1976976.1 hypothetical protein [Nanoarchaeota archaeon]